MFEAMRISSFTDSWSSLEAHFAEVATLGISFKFTVTVSFNKLSLVSTSQNQAWSTLMCSALFFPRERFYFQVFRASSEMTFPSIIWSSIVDSHFYFDRRFPAEILILRIVLLRGFKNPKTKTNFLLNFVYFALETLTKCRKFLLDG